MARQKKDGEKISLYLDRPTVERLRRHADVMGQSMTVALERSINGYLDIVEKKTIEEDLRVSD